MTRLEEMHAIDKEATYWQRAIKAHNDGTCVQSVEWLAAANREYERLRKRFEVVKASGMQRL